MRSADAPPNGWDPEGLDSDPSVYERLGLAPAHVTPAPAPPAPAPPAPAPPAATPAGPLPPALHELIVIAPVPRSAPTSRPAPEPDPMPSQQSTGRIATLERTAPVAVAETVIEVVPPTAAEVTRAEHLSLARRVAALPRVLLDTVAWGGFAAVVALIVIALSDVGMGRAALWAVGLSGIVVLAVAVMALSGARLDELNRAGGSPKRPD
jgi:hypothetical protein